MRADRLLSLILLLQAHGRLSAPDLAQRLEVSVRTVLRDVEALGAAGVPVYTERGRTGGIALLDSYRAGLAGLSRTEAASLVVGQPRLAADLGLGDALDTAIEKIMGAGGRALRSGIEHGRTAILVDVDPWMRSSEPVPMLPAVHDAIVRGVRVDLDYRDSEAKARAVTVDPLGLVAKAGVWYLVALAPDRPSLFRVSRVRSCRLRDEPAARPDGFDLGAAWADLRGGVERRPRDLEVRVAVNPATLPMARRLLASKLQPGDEQTPDGRPVLRVRFAAAAEAVGNLISFGTRVEVLEPPSVRIGLRETAQELLTLYRHRVPTPTEVIAKVMTTANPETGSAPPPDIAWAVFEHGTVFFAAPGDDLDVSAGLDDVEAAARTALGELGPVVVASSSADFTVSRLSGWYPEDPVWFVGFDSDTLATIVVEDFDSDLAAGMTGRALRDQDHEAMRLVAVRNFRGEQR